MDEKYESCFCFAKSLERRTMLKAAIGMVLGLPFTDSATAQEDDLKMTRPQEGDQFVFPDGEKKGEVITPEDLPSGGHIVLAFPMDPKTKIIRDGTRMNKVLLIRLDPKELSEETHSRSVDGIVAYSAICSHQACDVSVWEEINKTLWCPCHDSHYDPRDSAKVVSGPALRRLAGLPLKIVDGVLMAAGPFAGPIGPKKQQ
jgi:Rieske Fe-S protein